MTALKIPKLAAPAGYQTQAIDISIEADLLDFYLLRQRSPTERLAMAAHLMNGARQLSLHCLSQQFSTLKPQQFAQKIARAWLQEDCPADYIPSGNQMTWIQNSAELATQLHTVLEQANIRYYVTGGVAAITYGDPRTTRDLNVVLQIPRTEIKPLQTALEQASFHVAGVDDVISGRMKTLQITQIETISRADLMLADETPYARIAFERRRKYTFPTGSAVGSSNGSEVYVAAPEDVIISKLKWGLRSDSEKQRRDVLAILKVQQDALDYAYIRQWASEFDLSEHIEDLITAAGVREIADSST